MSRFARGDRSRRAIQIRPLRTEAEFGGDLSDKIVRCGLDAQASVEFGDTLIEGGAQQGEPFFRDGVAHNLFYACTLTCANAFFREGLKVLGKLDCFP